MQSAKIKIILVSGFLGSGKTTFLNKLLRQHSAGSPGLLINDFGSIPIDSKLVAVSAAGIIYEVNNGSIFCSCKTADFIAGLDFFKAEKPAFLFIEASGISDPSGMQKLLRDNRLNDSYEVV
ncbi:MAG TPA: GTP-binding protein, partial [Spirochaetota bacterium]|nr:GTP-binding protein [Spirochaetota bacterium]